MAPFTIITDDAVTTVEADLDGQGVRLDAAALARATGWAVKDEGLCRDEICVPRTLWPELLAADTLDLAEVARATGQVLALDRSEASAVLVAGVEERAATLDSLHAPDFGVEAIDGETIALADFRGRKKLLVAFASW